MTEMHVVPQHIAGILSLSSDKLILCLHLGVRSNRERIDLWPHKWGVTSWRCSFSINVCVIDPCRRNLNEGHCQGKKKYCRVNSLKDCRCPEDWEEMSVFHPLRRVISVLLKLFQIQVPKWIQAMLNLEYSDSQRLSTRPTVSVLMKI